MCMALLGERIRERRQELKLTQTELAQKTGLGQSSINRLENGDTPDAYELLRKSRYVIGEANLPAGLQAMRLPGARVIVVSRGLRAPVRLYAVLHELSHDLIPADGNHSDVYSLSLCLVHPPQQLEAVRQMTGQTPTSQDIFRGNAPQWCAVLRCRAPKWRIDY